MTSLRDLVGPGLGLVNMNAWIYFLVGRNEGVTHPEQDRGHVAGPLGGVQRRVGLLDSGVEGEGLLSDTPFNISTWR